MPLHSQGHYCIGFLSFLYTIGVDDEHEQMNLDMQVICPRADESAPMGDREGCRDG